MYAERDYMLIGNLKAVRIIHTLLGEIYPDSSEVTRASITRMAKQIAKWEANLEASLKKRRSPDFEDEDGEEP